MRLPANNAELLACGEWVKQLVLSVGGAPEMAYCCAAEWVKGPRRLVEKEKPMLVLSRYVGEWILIGDDIRIKVVAIGGGQVKLGIEAPPDVRVLREELLNKGENQENQKTRE